MQSPQVITSVLITSFLIVWKGIKLALRYYIFGRSQIRCLIRQQIMITDFLPPRILRYYQIVGRKSHSQTFHFRIHFCITCYMYCINMKCLNNFVIISHDRLFLLHGKITSTRFFQLIPSLTYQQHSVA